MQPSPFHALELGEYPSRTMNTQGNSERVIPENKDQKPSQPVEHKVQNVHQTKLIQAPLKNYKIGFFDLVSTALSETGNHIHPSVITIVTDYALPPSYFGPYYNEAKDREYMKAALGEFIPRFEFYITEGCTLTVRELLFSRKLAINMGFGWINDINTTESPPLLILAAQKRQSGIMCMLLSEFSETIDLEVKDARGYTALVLATKNVDPVCMQMLIQAGAEFSYVHKGKTFTMSDILAAENFNNPPLVTLIKAWQCTELLLNHMPMDKDLQTIMKNLLVRLLKSACRDGTTEPKPKNTGKVIVQDLAREWQVFKDGLTCTRAIMEYMIAVDLIQEITSVTDEIENHGGARSKRLDSIIHHFVRVIKHDMCSEVWKQSEGSDLVSRIIHLFKNVWPSFDKILDIYKEKTNCHKTLVSEILEYLNQNKDRLNEPKNIRDLLNYFDDLPNNDPLLNSNKYDPLFTVIFFIGVKLRESILGFKFELKVVDDNAVDKDNAQFQQRCCIM